MTKIAVATDDGKTVSQHFGRAPYYFVVTVEDGKVTGSEQRNKASHSPAGGAEHGAHSHHEPGLHSRMAQSIADCQVVLAGGMGRPAYQSLQEAGLKPVITDITSIDQAVEAYIAGRLVDHAERLH